MACLPVIFLISVECIMYKAMCIVSSVSSECDVNGFFCRGNNNVFCCFLYFLYFFRFFSNWGWREVCNWMVRLFIERMDEKNLNMFGWRINRIMFISNVIHIQWNGINWMWNVKCTWANSALKNCNVKRWMFNVQYSLVILKILYIQSFD